MTSTRPGHHLATTTTINLNNLADLLAAITLLKALKILIKALMNVQVMAIKPMEGTEMK